jgi:hypothetical protein
MAGWGTGQVLVVVLEMPAMPIRESDWMNDSGSAIVAALVFIKGKGAQPTKRRIGVFLKEFPNLYFAQLSQNGTKILEQHA